MVFLTLANLDIYFIKSMLYQRDYLVQLALLIKQYIELIELEIFANEALNINAIYFVVHIAVYLSHINPDRTIKMDAISVENNIKLPFEYSDYFKVFFLEEADKLFEYTKNNH